MPLRSGYRSFALALFLAGAPLLEADPVFLNGSFEAPPLGRQSFEFRIPDAWSGGGFVILVNNSYIPGSPSPFGNQCVALDSPQSFISQVVGGFLSGETYHFSIAIIGGAPEVTLGGAASGVFTVGTQPDTWQVVGFDFVPASSGTVSFTIAKNARIDNAQIMLVPEADTWVTLIAGATLLVGARRITGRGAIRD